MRKIKLDKKTSIRISSLAMAGMLFVTSFATTGCSSKPKEEIPATEVTIPEVTVPEEITFYEEDKASFIKNGKILQGVLMKINDQSKFAMGYFYEKNDSLYFHEIFNNETEYNFSYIDQVAPDFHISYCEAANVLSLDQVINQSISEQEYNEILSNISYGSYASYSKFILNSNEAYADKYHNFSSFDDILATTSVEKQLTK